MTGRQGEGARLGRWLGLAFVVALVVAALLAAWLTWRHGHHLRNQAERRRRELDPGPRVFVSEARPSPVARVLTLPADVRGFYQTTMYAKVSGYVRTMLVDKGDSVRKGQLLAVLQSPEVDQQVRAAESDLLIKKRTFERYRQLVARDFVSVQDFDTARAQYGVSRAALQQARALKDYENVRAPFAGTVTARYADPGALIPAATGSTQSALPLVDVADLRRVRILVFVQQDAAPFVRAGDPVEITVDQQPGLRIQAAVARIAQALDVRSRTMLCEIWLDNRHQLFPGTFVHVTFHLQAARLTVVPSSALMLHHDQPAVAVVRQSHLHFVAVRPGLDDGKTVQILEGLEPGERVALSVPAEIAEGALVRPMEQTTEGRDAGGEGPRDGGAEGHAGGDR